MPTFEITKVDPEPSTWTAKKGPATGQEFYSYKVTAKGPDGELRDFEINRKPSSGPPPLGAVEAEVQPSNGNFPDKLKLTPQGRSGGSSHTKDEYWLRKEARDIEGNRRMGRAHAQEMSVRVLSRNFGALSDDPKAVREQIKDWTDWFEADVDAAGGTSTPSAVEARDRMRVAEQALAEILAGTNDRTARHLVEKALAVRGEQQQDAAVNAERIGFASDKQKLFFERLLKDAGLTSNQVAEVCRYVREDLATDRVSKAIDAIKEGDRDKAIEALLQQSLEWHSKQTDMPFDDVGLPPLRENVA